MFKPKQEIFKMATAKKPSKAEKVRAYQAKHPKASAVEVSKATDTDVGYIYAIRHSDKNKAAKTPKKEEPLFGRKGATKEMMQDLVTDLKAERITMVEPPADNVNHPAHYKVGGIETIDFIEAKQLSYHLGNVVKYIARADSKGNREEDLLKARWYLNREIAKFGK
jgi:Protein of unknwon function (DUF3310)